MFRHCFFLLLISTRTAMELLGPLTLACMSVASLLRVLPLLLCARPWSLLLIRVLCSVVSSSLQPCGLWPARLLCPWDSPGKNTGVGCHALLQGVFPTQGSNLGLQHCRRILYQLSHKGSPLLTCIVH